MSVHLETVCIEWRELLIAAYILGLLSLGLLPNPWPRHAGISGFIRRVVFHVAVYILRLQRIMLQRGQCPDQVNAGREHHQHRQPIVIALKPPSNLIPTAHSATAWDALVVRRTERNQLGLN